MAARELAPSTTLRVVPLPRFAGEEPASPLILPRYGGGGPPKAVEGALDIYIRDAETPFPINYWSYSHA